MEIQRYDKETVIKIVKIGFDYNAVGIDNVSEVKEKNRIRIGTAQYDIIWTHNPGNSNRWWILHLQERDEAIT